MQHILYIHIIPYALECDALYDIMIYRPLYDALSLRLVCKWAHKRTHELTVESKIIAYYGNEDVDPSLLPGDWCKCTGETFYCHKCGEVAKVRRPIYRRLRWIYQLTYFDTYCLGFDYYMKTKKKDTMSCIVKALVDSEEDIRPIINMLSPYMKDAYEACKELSLLTKTKVFVELTELTQSSDLLLSIINDDQKPNGEHNITFLTIIAWRIDYKATVNKTNNVLIHTSHCSKCQHIKATWSDVWDEPGYWHLCIQIDELEIMNKYWCNCESITYSVNVETLIEKYQRRSANIQASV